MGPTQEAGRGNRAGVAWLLTDMALITVMTALVKVQGASYPAIQIVFIRAVIGLIAILPLIWRHRFHIRQTKRGGRHVFRISCNALALTANFAALATLPLAVVAAIGFMRPLFTMVLAVLMLGEIVGRMRWLGAAIGFCGVLIMVLPGELAWNSGLIAAFASVVFGSLAVVQTRMLREENTTVLMVFYTAGLAILTAVPAAFAWQPVALDDWLPLLAIGGLAQLGQYCFLRAYQSAPANVLAPIGYLSIVMATAVGYLLFDEMPGWHMLAGVAVILAGLQIASIFVKPANGRGYR